MTKNTALFLIECDVKWARKKLEEARKVHDAQFSGILSGEVAAIDSNISHLNTISALQTLIESIEEDLARITTEQELHNTRGRQRPHHKKPKEVIMTITAWTINAIGEVCYSLKENGTENFIKELYHISQKRLEEQKKSHKIESYTLKITIQTIEYRASSQ